MFHYTRTNPRRAAFSGYYNNSGVAGDYNGLALYNDSAYAEILIIRSISLQTPNNQSIVSMITQQGNPGGTPITVFPCIPTETPPPGIPLIFAGGAPPPNGFAWGVGVSNPAFNAGAPIAYLTPGWSILVYGSTTGQSIAAGILWEAIKPEQLFPEEYANVLISIAANGQ